MTLPRRQSIRPPQALSIFKSWPSWLPSYLLDSKSFLYPSIFASFPNVFSHTCFLEKEKRRRGDKRRSEEIGGGAEEKEDWHGLHCGAVGLEREGRVGEGKGEQKRKGRQKAENGGRETTTAGGPEGDEHEHRCGEKVKGNVAPKRGNGPLWRGRGEDVGLDRWESRLRLPRGPPRRIDRHWSGGYDGRT